MSELITPELVLLDQNLGETKFDVISKLAHAVVNASRATDYDQLYAAAEPRESKTDTGIPGGIAIPHCRSAAVKPESEKGTVKNVSSQLLFSSAKRTKRVSGTVFLHFIKSPLQERQITCFMTFSSKHTVSRKM